MRSRSDERLLYRALNTGIFAEFSEVKTRPTKLVKKSALKEETHTQTHAVFEPTDL